MNHPAYGQLRPVTSVASVLLADNPSGMTLDGTNTWIVHAPGASGRVVIDPGPEDADHLGGIAEHGPVELVLLTHRHPDHVDGVARLRELTGAPVRAFEKSLCANADPLADGELITAGGVELRVLATPGHTSDSMCFLVETGSPAVFTGDTVLGRGTSIVAHPDGDLGAYLDSLHRLAELDEGTLVLPGHGPELPDVRAAARAYLDHRTMRLAQIREAVSGIDGEPTVREVVDAVYADVDPSIRFAAEATVRAQLAYLRDQGEF